ncbi:MAG: D-alanine--D-alanine ligase [Oscillospiraceae bacterium]
MKIVVLAGGLSTERMVSLVSGTAACRALRERGHQAILVDMFMGLENYTGDLTRIFEAEDGLCSQVTIETEEPDLEAVRRGRRDQTASLLGRRVLKVCGMADIVFLGLHGACGEDGRIQAALDLLGIPYTGSGYLASGMAMDKAVAKRIMDVQGIRTPKWQELCYTAADIPRLTDELPVPCAVKIINGGSSLGVFLPDTREELSPALQRALQYGDRVVIEEKIRGREITVGVLGDRALPAVEIIPKSGYFDYASKYQTDGAQEICPAPLTPSQAQEMGEMALALHRALHLTVYSRSDFMLDEAGVPWCLEVNTLPGMTPISLLPREAEAVGLSYPALCEEIVRESLRIRKEP